MGVPALFRWLSQKYPKIVSNVIEEMPQEVDGEAIPVDHTGPNPNGEEMDNLYLDMNGIVHPCSHPDDRPPPETEGEMMLEVFKYTDRVVNMVRPRKILMIAVDGVAPRAKMNQQRSRRFRSAQEAKEKEEDQAEFLKMLKAGGKEIHESLENKKVWDSNAITPGTPFMDTLATSLRYWVAYKLNTDPAWAKLKVIISDSTVPGEGEHKIMEFVRSQRASPEHDPNTRHVIYGLDADLIMLGLGTHEPHFRVLREDVFFQESKARTCRVCNQKGHKAEECTGQVKEKVGEFGDQEKAVALKPFIWLHVSILREYLAAELDVPGCPFKFDLERAIDDWVFMCFFVGNDFLPHLPSLDIRDGAIDTLMSLWRENLPVMGGYVTKDGHVNLERAQFILDGLAKQEDGIFRRRKQQEDRRNDNAKRRKLEQERWQNGGQSQAAPPEPAYMDAVIVPSPGRGQKGKAPPPAGPPPGIHLFSPADVSKENKKINHDMIMNRGALRRDSLTQANVANKSAAAVLKAQLLGGALDEPPTVDGASDEATRSLTSAISAKRKAEIIEDNTPTAPATPDEPKSAEGEPNLDNVRLWEVGYRDRYYEQKFNVGPDDIEFRKKVAAHYVEGLCWVLLYYFQGCPSWTWYYPYHYAPFAADFQDLKSLDIQFTKGKPFKPFEQLMGVLPAASKHNLPEPFQTLMTSEDSEIIDFYPENFPIDLNGKKFAWQGVALLPFIDEKRLLDAITKQYPKLTPEDHSRNALGKDILYLSDRHPLYNDLASQFYSKRQIVDEYKLKSSVSDGLAGVVSKDDAYIPRSTIPYPLKEGGMPDLEDDRSMSVAYQFPVTPQTHKSMLLRGVKLATPILTRADLEMVKNKAANAGRYNGGGGPGMGRNNSGRGGRGGGGYHGSGGNRDTYTPRDSYNNNNSYGRRDNYNNNHNNGGGHQSWNNNPRWPPAAAQPQQSWAYPPPPGLPSFPAPGSGGVPPPPLPSWGGHHTVPGIPPPIVPTPGFSYGYPPPPPPVTQGGWNVPLPMPQHGGYGGGGGRDSYRGGGGGGGGRGGGDRYNNRDRDGRGDRYDNNGGGGRDRQYDNRDNRRGDSGGGRRY